RGLTLLSPPPRCRNVIPSPRVPLRIGLRHWRLTASPPPGVCVTQQPDLVSLRLVAHVVGANAALALGAAQATVALAHMLVAAPAQRSVAAHASLFGHVQLRSK